MTKQEKIKVVDTLTNLLNSNEVIYLADTSGLNAELTSDLRKSCYKHSIKLRVIKNTLLFKAMEKSEKDFYELPTALKGSTSVLFSDTPNAPAKLIKQFRKTSEKPSLKGAYLDESVYLGDDQLDYLVSIKSKQELIADVVGLLQSPVKNVISSLKSGGQKLSGLLKTLSDRQ